MLQQGAQPVPCLQMNTIVGLIAIIRLEVHGDRAIGRDAKTIDELLEIGSALLAMSPLELNGLGILTVVGTRDHDAGGIVVDLLHLEAKVLHGRQHSARLQGGAIRRKQPIESAGELIVAHLALSNQSRIVGRGPFLHRIERVAINQDILGQTEQRIGVVGVLQRHGQLFPEPHALDEVVQNR